MAADIRDLSSQLGASAPPANPVTIDVPVTPVGNAPQPMPPPPMPPLRQPPQPATPPPPAPSQESQESQSLRVSSTTIQPTGIADMKWLQRSAYFGICLWFTSTIAYLPTLWFPLKHSLAMTGCGALALTIWLVIRDGTKHPAYLAAILVAISGYVVSFLTPFVK
jgi:hypothetical protein